MGNKSSSYHHRPGLERGAASDQVCPIQKKKRDQGSIECEVLGFGPEAAESAGAWDTCTKNPAHAKFIPVPEFSLRHLPSDFQEESVLDFIRAFAVLTVRLRVDFVSWQRPKGYAFAENRGSRVLHVGSGLVTSVSEGKGPCPCKICSIGPSPCQQWFEIHLATACHVLYNTEEALFTRVDFFYDAEQSRREGTMKTLWGYEVTKKSKKSDGCFFTCATHDKDLVTQLQTFLQHFKQAKRNLPREIPTESLIVIVSHPHGQPKKVTVGELLKYQVNWAEPRAGALTWTLFYNTATCPGSSGAPVFEVSSRSTGYVYNVGAFHSGWTPKGNHSVRRYTVVPLY